MTNTVDVYWSFRSPYSYLATGRLAQMERELGVEVNAKVVLPIAVRTPDFFKQVNPLWPPYLMRDVQRLAEFHSIPYSWPSPDPVVQDIQKGIIPKEQPYIWRLSRLGVEAANRGRGLPFLEQVSHTIWSGEVRNWHEGEHLAHAAQRAGLDLAEMEANVAGNEERYDARLDQHQQDLQAAGHWGVPTMVYNSEVFFGQDRLDVLEWRIRQSI